MNTENKLCEACKTGDIQAVKECLRQGERVDSRDNMGKSCLYLACANGHTEIVKILLEAGADPREEPDVDGYGHIALIGACENGHTDIVKLLLDAGASVRIGWRGSSPFQYASRY